MINEDSKERLLEAQFALKSAGFTTSEILQITRKPVRHRNHALKERDESIVTEFKTGKTMEELGCKHSISRARIQQILTREGVYAEDGGAAERGRSRRCEEAVEHASWLDARTMRIYGVTFKKAKELNGGVNLSREGSLAKRFLSQRQSASTSGIPFDLNFEEFCQVWSESGKIPERGRGRGKYCLGRIDQAASFHIGNVHVIACEENSKVKAGKQRNVFNDSKKRDALGYTPKQAEARSYVVSGVKDTVEMSKVMRICYGTAYSYMRRIKNAEPQLFAEVDGR